MPLWLEKPYVFYTKFQRQHSRIWLCNLSFVFEQCCGTTEQIHFCKSSKEKLEFSNYFFLILESCTYAEVVAAVDVNTLANDVYKHNFPSTPLWAKTIEVSNQCVFYCRLGFVRCKLFSLSLLVTRETKRFVLLWIKQFYNNFGCLCCSCLLK